MSTVEYKPKQAKPLPAPAADIVIASPIKREEKGKTSPFKIILGIAMGVLMIFFLVIMFVVMGRQPNPIMLMSYTVMMVTVVGGAGAALMQGIGGGDGDLDRKRQNIDLQLAESAVDVHETATAQHSAALHFHNNPANLRRLIERRDATFWSGDVTAEAELAMLRIGVGTEQLAVQLVSKETGGADEAQEHLYEEYSAVAVSRFRSLMSVVPEVPLTREMSAPAYGFRGDQEGINGLVRSMLLSATYKYSPNKILVGVISRDDKQWGWTKWLPHSRNRLREPGPSGYQQLAWRTVNDFVADMSEQFDALAVTGTRMYVVVDDPDRVLRFPAEYPDGIPGVTFLAANVRSDAEVTSKRHRMRVDGDELRLHQIRATARADFVSRFDAELTARAMAPIRPEGYGFDASLQPTPEQRATAVDEAALPSIMEHLGIGNVDNFDLKSQVWDPNEYAISLETMFGYVLDENNAPTGELATLDLREIAAGGNGPHGMLSGGIGTGKSFMMTAIVLGLIAANSPSKLRLIMSDFKGGATWRKFQGRIGHEVATITNLEEATDLLERLKDVLEGEIIYRETLFSKYKNIDNIRQYRELARTNPDMEQLPYLLFIADEVGEFLKEHPEYRGVFERLGRIGRSLGLIVLLASQYLDEQTVGDFVKHAKYGISLKVTKPSESKTVLHGNENAIRLPPSIVALFYKTVNLQDTLYQRVKAWSWEAAYRRPLMDADPPAAPGSGPAAPDIAQLHVEDVTEFGMYHRPREVDAPVEDGPEPVRTMRTEESNMTIAEAVIQLVERSSRQYRSRELWTEPLRHPLSIPHVTAGWAPEQGKLQLRIGDVDVPKEHSRIPMIVDFSGSQSNCFVAGGHKTGKTNTIRALIAASELTYPADQMSWYIYDYDGTDLAAMATWPNVGGYAAKTDEDMFSRIRGEINRIIDLRTDVIGEHKIRNVDQYLAKKAELGVTADPYGHIFFAVDGLDRILDDAGQEYMNVRDEWVQLLSYGPRVGVHVVYTTRSVTGRMPKLVEQTGVKVYHNMEDPQVMDSTIRAGIKAIPITMPGGSINADRVDNNNRPQILRSRVFIPVAERIQPDDVVDGMPVFKIHDYSARIEEIGAQKRATAAVIAPQILQVPNVVPYANVIDAYKHIDLRSTRPGARVLPMGVDRATGRALALELSKTRHMFIAGAGHSGVSTALRTAINSITNVYRPDEASIVIIDGRMGLVDMVEPLESQGYMQKGRFASNSDSAIPIITKLGALMQSRQPAGNETPTEVRDREYVKGKEVFVIIDGFDTLRALQSGASAAGSLEWLGPRIPVMDVGVHLFVGTEGSGITRWVGMNKFTSSLTARSDVRNVFLNGNPGEGKIFVHEKIKFRKLPSGRAIWHSAGAADDQVIQIANSEELK